jgi:hypothetical protein
MCSAFIVFLNTMNCNSCQCLCQQILSGLKDLVYKFPGDSYFRETHLDLDSSPICISKLWLLGEQLFCPLVLFGGETHQWQLRQRGKKRNPSLPWWSVMAPISHSGLEVRPTHSGEPLWVTQGHGSRASNEKVSQNSGYWASSRWENTAKRGNGTFLRGFHHPSPISSPCYQLNCVPSKTHFEVLTPSTSECDIVWK